MPGYIIHLAEAKMIFDIFRKIDKNKKICSMEWLQKFSYGALLPDAVYKEKKMHSHFWNKEKVACVIMVPQVDLFLNKYNASMDTPELLGYLAHLDLDLKFWNEYMKECVEFQDENMTVTNDIRMVKYVLIKKTEEIILTEVFFSNEYLYGDYTKLNKYLIDKYGLVIPRYDIKYRNIVQEVDNKDMERVLSKLKNYIAEEDSSSLKVFSKKSLETFMENAAQQFSKRYEVGQNQNERIIKESTLVKN